MSESTRDYDLIRFPKDAWGKVPPFAYPTYVALLRFMGTKNACWPKISTLSEMTGLCERTVKRQLDSLRESGLISSERAGSYGRSRYSLGGLSSDTNVTCQALSSDTNVTCVVTSTSLHEVTPTSPPIEDYREKTTKKHSPLPLSEPAAFDTTEAASECEQTIQRDTDERFEKGKNFLAICRMAKPSMGIPTQRYAVIDIGQRVLAHDLSPSATGPMVLEVLKLAFQDDFWRDRACNPRKVAEHLASIWNTFEGRAATRIAERERAKANAMRGLERSAASA